MDSEIYKGMDNDASLKQKRKDESESGGSWKFWMETRHDMCRRLFR